MLNQNNKSLDFSKGFTYNNQDLDNVHNSADEIKELNDERFSQYLGVKISKEPVSKEDWNKFANGLTDSQTDIVLNLMNQGVSKNAIMAYIPLADNYKNPTSGTGVGLFEKKDNVREGKNFGNTKPSALGKLAKRGLGTLGVLEGLGWTNIGIGHYQLNKTLDKYLPEDAARAVRFTKYEEVPKKLTKILEDTEAEITKAESRLEKMQGKRLLNAGVNDEIRGNLEELYARRDSIKETINAMNQTKKNLPSEKPETARQTGKKMNLWGNDLKAAGKAATEKSIYYTTEIAPIYKQVKSRFSIPKLLSELTKADFPGKTEGQRKEIQELINKEIEAYADYTDISVEEIHNKLDDFNLDKEAIKGEDPKGITSAFKKAAYTKINNAIDEAIEAELPGRGIKNKRLIYNNMGNVEEQLKDYAVSGGKRKPGQGVIKDIIDSVKSPTMRRGLGTTFRTIGNAIKPSTYTIEPIINRFKNKTKSQISEVASKIEKKSPEIAKKAKEEVKTVAKDFKQPKLFGDSMNEGAIIMSYINEKMGLEMPIEKITEIVSYALETNKLNKEGRDLPLYDKENSYVNQNPNAGKLESIMNRDNSIYEQDWYKQLESEEEKQTEEYLNRIKNIDIDELLNSLE